MKEIIFVAKIHKQNGYSFYLPTKLVEWLNLSFGCWNNTAFVTRALDEPEHKIDCSATRYRKTWKFSFYPWELKGWKAKQEYLIRIPLKVEVKIKLPENS